MSAYDIFSSHVRDNSPVALASIIEGPNVGALLVVTPEGIVGGTLGNTEIDRVVSRDTMGELEAGRTIVRHYGPEGQSTPEDLIDTDTVRVFIESFSPPPLMWIFGAVDFTAALARVAKILGYHVTVCDAREIFATRRRFPMADEVRVTWPTPMFEERGNRLGPRDAVCILTHDPKFDVPAIEGALATKVGYIGVMGSRKTHAKRLERLAEVGISSPDQLARVHSPIGLDLGGRTPEETAISIVGEIISSRTGRAARSLGATDGPIH
jgi:xanthine dehydrogenase accessory factor